MIEEEMTSMHTGRKKPNRLTQPFTIHHVLFAFLIMFLVVGFISAASQLMQDPRQQQADEIRLTESFGDSNSSYLAIDVYGATHIVWQDKRTGNYEIFYNKIIQDNFQVYPFDLQVTYHGGASKYPCLAFDTLGNIHLVWQDHRDGNWEIYYKKLDSIGQNLTSDERVTNDPASSIRPTITIDSDNTVYVTWYDNRDGNYGIYWNKRIEPDVTPTQLTTAPRTPFEGDTVLINTTISNNGRNNATDIMVACLVDNISIDTQIITLSPSTSQQLTFTWQAIFGTHDILISVDPNDTIAESDEANNTLSHYLSVFRITEFINQDIPASASITHDVALQVDISETADPNPGGTSGSLGTYVNYTATSYFQNATLRIDYEDGQLGAVDETSLRMYVWDQYDYQGACWKRIDDSGVNTEENYVWANVTQLGLMTTLGNQTVEIPVGLWHFDEGNGTIAHDSSPYYNNGTITGATWISGCLGSALYFHGGGQWFDGDCVTVPHSESLAIDGPFSIEATINATGTDNYLAIVDKYQYINGSDNRGFSLYLSNGLLRFTVYCGANGNKNVWGTTDLRDGICHTVKAVWNGSALSAYVDGDLQGQTPWTYPPGATTQNLGIGKRLSGWGGYLPFLGVIDEVSINRYTAQLTGDCFYQNMSPVDALIVDITNLNTGRKWQMLSLNNYFSLVLTPWDDIHAGETLQVIARDSDDSVNVTNHVVNTSEINARTILLTLILNIHYLDLKEFPMHEAETGTRDVNQMTGAAALQMMLNYLTWNKSTDPTPPMTYDNQSLIYDMAHENNTNTSLEYIDAGGMEGLLIDEIADQGYGYHFFVSHNDTQDGIAMRICGWIDFNVSRWCPLKEGHPAHVPALIPAYGDYSHWMAIRGIHTNKNTDPYPSGPPSDIEFHGFWVNDPLPQGIGENTYKTADEFFATYYSTLSVEDDPYTGQYVAVSEPPEGFDDSLFDDIRPTFVESPAKFSEQDARILKRVGRRAMQAQLMNDLAENTIFNAAMNAITDIALYDIVLADLIDDMEPVKTIYVRRIGGPNYCIGVFSSNTDALVVRINSKTGQLLEFSISPEPASEYLNKLGIKNTRGIAYAVYTDGSPFYPTIVTSHTL